jgi:pentatricopeptide repeat protein
MQLQGVKADLFTFVYILKACTDIIALEEGLLIHYIIIEMGIELDSCLGSTLIDFHAKCNSIKDATNVFVHLPKQNVVTWSAMIGGYTLHGNHEAALQSFKDMKHLGLEPDDVMFISLLSTCAQMGLVDEGKDLFDVMTNEFGLVPSGEHYNCLVDLLGRVGRLTEAEALMELAPAESSFVGWMTLLSHCRAHGWVAMAKRCFEHIVALDCGHGSAYVLMSDIYTGAGMWDDAERIGKMKNFSQAWKKPGQASVEVNKKVHTFVVGDRTHPQKEGIYSKLNHLNFHLLMAGYVPHTAMRILDCS